MAEQQTQAVVKKSQQEIEFSPLANPNEKVKLSIGIIRTLIAEPGKNGEVPDDRQCIRFMMLCKARQLNPFEGDAFMIPFFSTQKNCYEWSLITAHSAFLKRAEIHPDYAGKQSGIIITPPIPCKACSGRGIIEANMTMCPRCKGSGEVDELMGDYLPDQIGGEEVKLAGGWCRVYYKSKNTPEYQRLKLSAYQKPTNNWRQDPAGMICKCAEAASLRSAFPNTIGGMYLMEEMAARGEDTFSIRKPIFKSLSNPDIEQTATVTPVEVSPVAKVRELCAKSNVKEPILIAFLQQMGCVHEKDVTLEAIADESPDIIVMVAEQWNDISAKIAEYIKATEVQAKEEADDSKRPNAA